MPAITRNFLTKKRKTNKITCMHWTILHLKQYLSVWCLMLITSYIAQKFCMHPPWDNLHDTFMIMLFPLETPIMNTLLILMFHLEPLYFIESACIAVFITSLYHYWVYFHRIIGSQKEILRVHVWNIVHSKFHLLNLPSKFSRSLVHSGPLTLYSISTPSWVKKETKNSLWLIEN